MLKQIKIYLLLIVTISFVACSEDNEVTPLFDEESNTRVLSELDTYKNILTNSENGWKTEYQPSDEEAIFTIHFTFNEDNSVEIISDYNNGQDDLPTTYKVGISQLPELIFENYSILHSLFNINNFSLGAEYEFILDEVTADKITLKSKSDNGDKSVITLIPALATDKDGIINLQGLEDRLKDGYNTADIFRTLTVKNTANEKLYISEFSFDHLTRRADFIGKDVNDNLISNTTGIKITDTGFDFVTPFSLNETEFSSFIYDENTNSFVATIGDLIATISSSDTPGFINDDVLLIQNGNRSGFGYDISNYGTASLQSDGFWNIISAIDANLLALGDGDKTSYYVLKITPNTNTVILEFGSAKIDGSDNPFSAFYEFSLNITDDNTFKLTYVGLHDNGNGTGLASFWKNSLQPLIDFWASPNGFVYKETGAFLSDEASFTNPSGKFINIANPTNHFYGIWWNHTD